MKKVLAFALALVALFPTAGFAFPQLFDLEIPIGATELIIPKDLYFVPVLVDENGEEITATWTNEEKSCLWGSEVFTAVTTGENELIAKTDDAEYKINIVVPDVYVSDEEVIIETPKAVLIAYQTNVNGISSVSTKGDAVYYEVVKQDKIVKTKYRLFFNMCEEMTVLRLEPVKAGSFKIIIKANGKVAKTINVTVKDSAIE